METRERRLFLRNPSGNILFVHSTTDLVAIPKTYVVDARGYYYALGLDPYCSMDDIKHRGRELAKELHPDTGGDVEEFMRLQEVLDVLLDYELRKAYDSLTPFDVYLSPLDIDSMISTARVNGDMRVAEEILQDFDVRPVCYGDIESIPQGTIWSYFVEDGVEETEQRMTNLRLWHEEILQAAWNRKWKSIVRVALAETPRRFKVEWRWGQPIFVLGKDIVPTQLDADIAVLYAATNC